ncbi:MAG: SRPBCC domain-containing protein [Actinomycetota bacterium]
MTAIPPVLRSAVVARALDDTFRIFTDEIGAWWPLPTHSVFQAESGGVHFEDGRLVEWATDGRESVWAEVSEWSPPGRLVLEWHPGRELGASGTVEITFEAFDGGTRVDVIHRGWEAFGEDGLARRRDYVGPSAWGHVLDHLADGTELHVDGPDLEGLEAAYAAFFAEATAGDFDEPDDGGWTGDQVIAHVALNDLALSAVAQALVHRRDPTFANAVCQDLANLDRVVDRFGDRSALIAFGRRCADQAIGAVRRLDDEQRAHLVPGRFEHDGAVVMEQAMPWASVAIEIQATRHLPAHIEQLQALRR